MGSTAPPTAITAVVVGVIASLALFFIAHVAINPRASDLFGTHIDWVALGVAAGAVLALLRFKQGVIRVIVGCALAGLLARVLGWP